MISKKDLPEVVRVKRRISEDPLQALVLESRQSLKRSKSSTFVFKFARTDVTNRSTDNNGSILKSYYKNTASKKNNKKSKLSDSITSQDLAKDDQKTFLLQSSSKEDTKDLENMEGEVPQELADMVKEYLQLEERDKQPNTSSNSILSSHSKNPTDDGYVYDVYYRDKAIYDENEKLGSNIGIIKFADEDLELLTDEEDSDSDFQQLSDDEDSNAEDFYRNDYPENEDDDKGIVIGNEDEWYSDEDDYYKQMDEEDEDYEFRKKYFEESDNVMDRLKKENKAFDTLSPDEVNYLYHEFYEEENGHEQEVDLADDEDEELD